MYEVPGQRYDINRSTAPFVCGKTWLYFRSQLGGSCSIHSLQVENPAVNGRLLMRLHDAVCK